MNANENRGSLQFGASDQPTSTSSYYSKSWAVVLGITDYGGCILRDGDQGKAYDRFTDDTLYVAETKPT